MFSDCSRNREAGLIRTDLIRRMMNPLDAYPDLFAFQHAGMTTRYLDLLNVQSDRPPQIKPGPLPTSLKTGWNFG
jgi:hypothetical protein